MDKFFFNLGKNTCQQITNSVEFLTWNFCFLHDKNDSDFE